MEEGENAARIPTATQRRVVLLLVVLLPLLASLPNWRALHAHDPPDRAFLGFGHLPDDQIQYATFMAQAREGRGFFLRDLLTGEDHPGRLIATVPWLTGRAARLLGTSEVGCWWALQLLAGVALLLLVWHAAGRFSETAAERLAGFLLATTIAGFGWIPWVLARAGFPSLRLLDGLQRDYWNWNVTSSMGLPLWTCGQAALIVAVLAGLRHARAPSWPRGLAVGASALAAWLVHPYSGVAAFASLALLGAMPAMRGLLRTDRPAAGEPRRVAAALAPVLAAAAAAALILRWASADPAVAHAAAQVVRSTLTYQPIFWPLAMGVVLLLAFWGAREARRRHDPATDALLAWCAGTVILAMSPFLSGYKYQFLTWLPLSLLAARGLTWLRSRWPSLDAALARPATAAAIVALLAVGTVLGPVVTPVSMEKAFAEEGELECLEVLRELPGGVLLVAPARGGIAAWKSVHQVHAGHWFLTIDADRKRIEAEAMLAEALPAEDRARLLAESRIRWVLLPPSLAGIDLAGWGRLHHESGGWRLAEVPR